MFFLIQDVLAYSLNVRWTHTKQPIAGSCEKIIEKRS